ncbi:MAG: ABC transporter permease [Dethiobacteria bacterium]|jgi:peptide/nickel transport system permease protein
MMPKNESSNKAHSAVLGTTYEQRLIDTFGRHAKKLFKSKTGIVGLVIMVVVITTAIFAPYLAPHDPTHQDYSAMSQPPAWHEEGTAEYLLGTDHLGRDLLSRIIYGTRISLIVGLVAVILAGTVGMIIGLLSGFFGGICDAVFMRITDAFLAIPSILFALVMLASIGPGVFTLILALGLTNWMAYARLVRGEVLSIRERDFVKAARSIGVSNGKIIVRHILPNVLSSFIVVSALTVATTIIVEASLSFLGLGIQPPTISWGVMLSDGRDYLATNWWIATFPGLAITITVLGIIFIGDWLRDLLDPRSQGEH